MGQDFPGGPDGKESAHNERDPDSIPGSGRSPGKEMLELVSIELMMSSNHLILFTW